jgi:hypothetical protein
LTLIEQSAEALERSEQLTVLNLADVSEGNSIFLATGWRQNLIRWWLRITHTNAGMPWAKVYQWHEYDWQALPGFYQLLGSSVSCSDRDTAEPVTSYYKHEFGIGRCPSVHFQYHPEQPLVNEHERLSSELYLSSRIIHSIRLSLADFYDNLDER